MHLLLMPSAVCLIIVAVIAFPKVLRATYPYALINKYSSRKILWNQQLENNGMNVFSTKNNHLWRIQTQNIYCVRWTIHWRILFLKIEWAYANPNNSFNLSFFETITITDETLYSQFVINKQQQPFVAMKQRILSGFYQLPVSIRIIVPIDQTRLFHWFYIHVEILN